MSLHAVFRLATFVDVVEIVFIVFQNQVGIDELQFLGSGVADVHFLGFRYITPLGFPVVPTLYVAVVQVESFSFQQQ